MYHSHNSPKQKKIDKTGDKEYLANYLSVLCKHRERGGPVPSELFVLFLPVISSG